MWLVADAVTLGSVKVPFLYVLLMVATPVAVGWMIVCLMGTVRDDFDFVVLTRESLTSKERSKDMPLEALIEWMKSDLRGAYMPKIWHWLRIWA